MTKYSSIPMIHPLLTALGMNNEEQKRIRTAFLQQRRDSKARGIQFKFNYDDWLNWWGSDILNRGVSSGDKLVMARYGDTGCYEPDNCYKSTSSDNVRYSSLNLTPYKRTDEHKAAVSAAHKGKTITSSHRQAITAKLKGKPNLKNAKAVATPAGKFDSRISAARYYNISASAFAYQMKIKPKEFYYI